MMKRFLTLLLLLGSTSLYSDDRLKQLDQFFAEREKVVRSTNEAFLKDKTLYASYNSSFSVENGKESFNKMIKDISDKLAIRLKEKSNEMLSYDTCSSYCIDLGSSDIRKAAFSTTNGLTDLSSDTRQCQNVCKVYMATYNGYYDGVKDNFDSQKKKSVDCVGDVNTATRGTKARSIAGSSSEVSDRQNRSK